MGYVLNRNLIIIDYNICMFVHDRRTRKSYRLNEKYASLIYDINNQSNDYVRRGETRLLEKLKEMDIVVFNETHEVIKIRKYDESCGLDVIQLEITERCNFKCKHCYLEQKKETYREDMSTNEIFCIIDEASQLGVQEFNITGGEPLLHKDIKKILKYIYECGMITRLYTNGYLLTDELINFLADIHIGCVRISIDGLKAEMHDEIRRVKSFERIEQNINKLLMKGIIVEISTTAMRTNLEEIPMLIKKYDGIENIRHIVDVYLPDDCNDALRISEAEYVDAIKERFISKCSNCGSAKKHCGIDDNYMFINNKGIGKLCPTLPVSLDLGNVIEDGIKDTWESRRKTAIKFMCEERDACEFGKICDGGCRSRALYNYGKTSSAERYICELYKYLKKIDYISI